MGGYMVGKDGLHLSFTLVTILSFNQTSEMAPLCSVFSFLLPLASLVSAWGTLGHETVALIAQNFVSAKTKTFAQGILNNSNATYLANVATWADSYRYTAAGRYSAPFHFIDAEDSPPHSCNVDLQRDCGEGGCVVGAIANYVSLFVLNLSLM
jgi:hypothetical protein